MKEVKTIFIRSLAVKEKGKMKKYLKRGTSLREKLFCFLSEKTQPYRWAEEKGPVEEKSFRNRRRRASLVELEDTGDVLFAFPLLSAP